jgi:hypothetical protein
MPWYKCTVNEVGPATDGTETPPPVMYLNLTDQAGSFTGAWFYAANGGQASMLAVAIAAMNSNRPLQVGADAPNPGNSPYTAISRLYLMKE